MTTDTPSAPVVAPPCVLCAGTDTWFKGDFGPAVVDGVVCSKLRFKCNTCGKVWQVCEPA